MYDAMGVHVDVSFDLYIGPVNFLLASYVFPHITAVIRLLLYQRADEAVLPH